MQTHAIFVRTLTATLIAAVAIPTNALADTSTTAIALRGSAPGTTAQRSTCSSRQSDATVVRLALANYPEFARELGATGEVDVKVSLSTSGSVNNASIYHSSGNGSIDLAAIEAAKQSTYSSERIDCQPVSGAYLVHVSFEL
jgi:TonB family protein